jgi:tetratricopeptide (TPR) repeat protein
LAGGQQHAYQIALNAGEYLNLVVEQLGIDVVVKLIAPDGKQLLEVDSPNGEQGPEPLAWIAALDCAYRLEVGSLEKDAKAGHYQAKLIELRRATPNDRAQVAQTLALQEAEQLSAEAGQFDKALPVAEQALAIREKTLGAKHLDTSSSLNTFALIHQDKGDYVKAEPLYQRALTIHEKKLGAEHPSTATSLNNLAAIYKSKGDYAKAESLHQRALAIYEKSLGVNHPLTATSLNNLAALSESKGDAAQAVALRLRASAIEERNIAINTRTGSERQKQAYLATLMTESESTVSLHARSAPKNAAARDLALTVILQRKGRALDAMTNAISLLRKRINPEDQALLDRLQDLRSQHARLVLTRQPQTAPAEHQAKIKFRPKTEGNPAKSPRRMITAIRIIGRASFNRASGPTWKATAENRSAVVTTARQRRRAASLFLSCVPFAQRRKRKLRDFFYFAVVTTALPVITSPSHSISTKTAQLPAPSATPEISDQPVGNGRHLSARSIPRRHSSSSRLQHTL